MKTYKFSRKSFITLLICILPLSSIFAKNKSIDDVNNSTFTRTYDVTKGFSAISTDLIGNIFFTQVKDIPPTLKITGPEDYVKQLEVDVKSGILNITSKSNKMKNSKKVEIKIYITDPDLVAFTQRGVSNFTIQNEIGRASCRERVLRLE